MLNEAVDFKYLNVLIIASGIIFMIIMWGSFFLFHKFKGRDDARRQNFKDRNGL